MTRARDRELLRRLADEPAEPGVEEGPAELARLEALWVGLEPPPVAPAPPGFAGRVMSRIGEEASRRGSGAGRLAVASGRFAAASALAAGLLAGAGLGMLIAPADREAGPAATSAVAADVPSQAAEFEEEEELLATAVEAVAGGEWAGEPAAGLAASFGADPDLAGGYLAALAALEEESL